MDLNRLFALQFMMFAEMAVGYLVCKFHVVKASDRSVLSNLVVNVFLPANIISSFNMELSKEVLSCFAQIFVASCGVQILCMIIAKVAFNGIEATKKPIMQYGTVCSNAGYLGNAVAEGVYGSEGLLYGQIYLIPLRIVMWTAGVSFFAKGNEKKNVLKTLCTHPCIIAVFIGLIRMAFQIPVPYAVDQTLSSLGKCSSPLIMLFIGMILYEIGFKGLFTKDNILFSVLRLLVIPSLVLVFCMVLHLNPLITSISVVLAAMPAGTTTAIVADQYNCNVSFAANCVVLSTILSIALLPAWVVFLASVL